MAHLSPFHRDLLDCRTPYNSFVATLLRSDGEPPCPWFGKSKPLTDEFTQKSKGAAWLEVHGLIELDRSIATQRWIWSVKGRAYRELIRTSGVNHLSSLRDFPPVPE